MKLSQLWRVGALLTTTALGLGLGACETDLDPNDDYHETTLLYAVLDPAQRDDNGQPVQRISISKAYLNTGTNAVTIAATRPDSVTFPAGVIAASLRFLRRDPTTNIEFPLERVPNDRKPTGFFAQQGQVIYQTPAGFPGLDTDSATSYQVVVRNTRTGTVAEGTTNLPIAYNDYPNAAQVLVFSAAYTTIGRNQQTTLREFDPEPATYLPRVAVRTQRRAGVYSVDMTFRFREYHGTDSVDRVLTWPIITNVLADASQEEVERRLAPDAFFSEFLIPQLNPAADPPGTRRRVVNPNPFTFRAYAGSPQWARYLNVQNASSAISQTTPEYTNVTGGRGLVTGRAQHSLTQSINVTGSGRAAFARHPELQFVF